MKYRLISTVAISTLLMSSMVFASSEVVEPTEEVVVVEEGVEPYVNIVYENVSGANGAAYSSEFETDKNSTYINYDYKNYASYPATVSLQVKTGINSWSTISGSSFVVQPYDQDHYPKPYTNIDPSETYRIKVEHVNGSSIPVSGLVQVAEY